MEHKKWKCSECTLVCAYFLVPLYVLGIGKAFKSHLAWEKRVLEVSGKACAGKLQRRVLGGLDAADGSAEVVVGFRLRSTSALK